MSSAESTAPVDILPVKPADAREFTLRSVLVAIVVAAVIGGSYPYVVLKLGFGPNISVVSAFFGYLALGILARNFHRWENNIVQTAGTSAGQTAFLCTLMAAFDLLRMDPAAGFTYVLQPHQAFLWLTCSGVLGVLLSVPMRKHFVVDEKLTFADGVAAAETLVVLDGKGGESRGAARSMAIGSVLSGFLMTIREDARLLGQVWYRLPEMLPIGGLGAKMNVGMSWSLLSIGSGLLVGMRINTSMVIGMTIAWVIAPPILVDQGFVANLVRREVQLWILWPAVGCLVAGGLTTLALRWKVLVKSFRGLTAATVGGEFPLRWVIWGSIASAVALALVQRFSLGMPFGLTAIAIVLSIPLMLVGIRVLGETNWGPISALTNMMQGIFGAVAPGSMLHNLTASGVTGSVASQSEGLMQDYKTGHLIGSTPRFLTYAQLIAVPVGAAAVAFVYPLLRDTYGIGGDNGLQSPISQRFAGLARILSAGVHALPPGAAVALLVGVTIGVLLTFLENDPGRRRWTPSPTGIGIGMLVPGSAVFTMFVGGLLGELWRMTSRQSYERHVTPLASGFIAGEAIIAVLIPILVVMGLVHLH
ncbi:MAG TPA: OPT family oligopeptide transporter [Candidatus Eisenbacteria bacterium]|nr:OPT family oligopeptide transporter [Candidatus Eisenbacteria bacterium]